MGPWIPTPSCWYWHLVRPPKHVRLASGQYALRILLECFLVISYNYFCLFERTHHSDLLTDISLLISVVLHKYVQLHCSIITSTVNLHWVRVWKKSNIEKENNGPGGKDNCKQNYHILPDEVLIKEFLQQGNPFRFSDLKKTTSLRWPFSARIRL